MAEIALATEGNDDLAAAERLVELTGHSVGRGPGSHSGHGELDKALPAYARAARHRPWLVLRDLDREVCPPALIARLVPEHPAGLLLRIPVRAVESWFFADPEALAAYLAVAVARIPRDADGEEWPKQTMVNLARASRDKRVVADMVPAPGDRRIAGPAYSARLVDFARGHWRPDVARKASPSLARAIRALTQLAPG